MRNTVSGRLAFLLSLLPIVFAGSAWAQTTPTWFDINPSRSNTDNDDPNGASGGRINHVAAASDLSRVYAATEWGGLYTSFDQGNTWVRINTFSPSATWDVKVDPNNAKRVYATSFFDGRVNPRSGINVSDDAGASWTTVNIPGLNTLPCRFARAANEPSGWQIAINPTNTAMVFVGTNCGLARLDTTGTWTFIDPSPVDSAEQVYAVIAHGQQIVDVITDTGHFRSNDNGGTWTPIPAPPGPTAGNSGPGSTIAVSPAESYVLLAADTNNIFESQDGGTTWPTSVTLPLINGGTNQQGRIPFVKTNQLTTSSQFDVWFGDVNLFKATATTPSAPAPGGAARTPLNSWTRVQDGGHADVGDVMFDPRASSGACPELFSSDGGVYRNTRLTNPDCQRPQWEQPTITPHATWLWGMDGIQLFAGIHALTYGLQDNGGWAATTVLESYNPPPPNWNNYTCCDVLHNSQGDRILSLEGQFGSGRAFRLDLRNRDGGGSNQIANYPSNANFTRFESGRQNVPFSGSGAVVNLSGVYFTTDITSGGIAWTPLSAPSAPNSGTGNLKVANLGGRPNVYYHTGNGNPESTGTIFRSSLVGTTAAAGNWTQMTLPAGVVSATAWDVDPNNGQRVIISGINGASNNFEIWMTQNFGANWTRLFDLENKMLGITPRGGATFVNRTTQGLTTGGGFGTYWQPSLFKFDPLDPTTLVAGAVDAGVFLSLDDGANWQLVSSPTDPTSNSPHIPRPLFAYFSPGRFASSTSAFDVWVGTRGAGVMKVVLDQK